MNYDSLLLTSGGTKGYAILGALRYLECKNYLPQFNKILGISVGSLIGFLIVLKYKIKDIFYILSNYNVEDIYFNKEIAKINLINNFLQNYSINNSEGILKLLKYFMINKKININITFKELYDKNPIELIIIATNLNKYKLKYFSYKLTPNIPILLALKASICIPFIFKPIKINNEYFVDGGLITFELIKYTNKKTLIIQLNTNEMTNNCNINNLEDYIIRVFNILFSQSIIKKKYNKYKNNSIILNFLESGLICKLNKNFKKNFYNKGIIESKLFIHRKLILKKIFNILAKSDKLKTN